MLKTIGRFLMKIRLNRAISFYHRQKYGIASSKFKRMANNKYIDNDLRATSNYFMFKILTGKSALDYARYHGLHYAFFRIANELDEFQYGRYYALDYLKSSYKLFKNDPIDPEYEKYKREIVEEVASIEKSRPLDKVSKIGYVYNYRHGARIITCGHNGMVGIYPRNPSLSEKACISAKEACENLGINKIGEPATPDEIRKNADLFAKIPKNSSYW